MPQTDSFLDKAARKMVDAASRDEPLTPLLRTLCPQIHRQIEEDGNRPPMLARWGRCANVDENTGTLIVAPPILQAIGEIAGVPMKGRFVHAGLQHTYGYLFSLIETPYGKKRDRWLSTDLERSFGLPLSLLGPFPRRGTLLANATWFFGHIALRDDPASLAALKSLADYVAPHLVRFDFKRLSIRRIIEQATHPEKPAQRVAIHTDLVPYPQMPTNRDAEDHLLVYSVRNGASSLKLITAFSVTSSVVRDLEESVQPGEVEVRLRYNAYVPGLYGKTMLGKRSFQN